MLLKNKKIKKNNLLKIILAGLFFISLSQEAISSNSLNNLRVSHNVEDSKIRIVFDADKKINYKFKSLLKKNSLKINFRDINIKKSFKIPKFNNKYIKNLKLTRKGSSLNFDFKSNSEFKYKYFSLEPNNKYGHRLILDIYLIKKKLSPSAKKIKKPKIIIAIDAGHGGRDPGAVGKNGTKEKDIVLSISKKLYNLLRKEKKIKPVLIRSGDKYISLRQRIKKARKYKADLFISIHADAAKNRKAKGSSVYVLSQHGASSEAAKWLANKENSVDLVGGISIDDKDNTLAQVILDMSQSATIETSLKASRIMLKKLKKISTLHSSKTEQAGFVVLKSPDIPSMLIETAYLSNPTEEKKLKTNKFQNTIAKAIRDGILEIIKKGII